MKNIDVDKIMFLDIETVPQCATYADVDERGKHLWDVKAEKIAPTIDGEKPTPDAIYDRAGIYAEFGKIVCISVGFVRQREGHNVFVSTSYFDDDECHLLADFATMVTSFFEKSPSGTICGHNVKEFDVPYICRRMIINNVPIPAKMNLTGKKPWENELIDTLELWRFGDYKNYTSLNLLTYVLGIPTPKDDIDGSQVFGVYYTEQPHEEALKRIAIYCEKDILATAQVYLRLNNLPLIDQSVDVVHRDAPRS